MQSNEIPRLLTAEQVSALIGVTVGTLQVWRHTKQYNLRYVKVGSLVKYREVDVAEFINSRVHGPRALSIPRARKCAVALASGGGGERKRAG